MNESPRTHHPIATLSKWSLVLACLTVPSAFSALTWQGCPDLKAADFREVPIVNRKLDADFAEPVSMWIHKDGKVFWVQRASGQFMMFDPATGAYKKIGEIKVRANSEQGARYLTLDPDFDRNRFAYVFYSAPPVGTYYENRVSRMTLGSDWSMQMASEKVLLRMPWSNTCCHQGGALGWDAQGNLYISTGNNTSNDDGTSDDANARFAPMYEPTPDFDNQGRTANSLDWRGKILRIHPDGSDKGYSIPAGNLFPPGTDKTLPEIYAMGVRNPYSLYVDKYHGWVAWGDIGPDAKSMHVASHPGRGPGGVDEWNLITKPSNTGWPYFSGNNIGYPVFNPVSGLYDGPVNDPNAPANHSRNNTGVKILPAAAPAILWETKANNPAFPTTSPWFSSSDGTAAITGPIYYYDGKNPSRVKLPPHFHGKWLISDFNRANFMKAVTLNDQGTAVLAVDDFPFPIASTGYDVIDAKVGPDGALYLAHYGANGSSTDTRIVRIEYTGSCQPDVTPIVASVLPGRNGDGRRMAAPPGADPVWPAGMAKAEAYDLAGALLWRGTRESGNAAVGIPRQLRAGLVVMRFLP